VELLRAHDSTEGARRQRMNGGSPARWPAEKVRGGGGEGWAVVTMPWVGARGGGERKKIKKKYDT